MDMSNALISWTGMLYKNILHKLSFCIFYNSTSLQTLSAKNIKIMLKKFALLLCFAFTISACIFPDHSGFYNPATLRMSVPDGPPEYKAGWHDGCQTGASLKTFANNAVFRKDGGPNFGSGVYAHDPAYQTGWGQGWFACAIHIGILTDRMVGAYPLQ